jgi:hypothetical protein
MPVRWTTAERLAKSRAAIIDTAMIDCVRRQLPGGNRFTVSVAIGVMKWQIASAIMPLYSSSRR